MTNDATQPDSTAWSGAHRHYLDLMGIDVWIPREPSPTRLSDSTPVNHQALQTQSDETSKWRQLQQTVAVCQACSLHQSRTQTVFGVGNPHADWLFVGEAPGAEEDKQGEPFVGRAGQLLNAMLHALGLRRDQVYIANVLKCRPPNNRDPQAEEVQACEPYLIQQIEQIRPKIIVALGRHAVHSLLKTDQALGRLRGMVHNYQGTPLIATYHPAYLLRSPQDKAKAWTDLRMAKKQVIKS